MSGQPLGRDHQVLDHSPDPARTAGVPADPVHEAPAQVGDAGLDGGATDVQSEHTLIARHQS